MNKPVCPLTIGVVGGTWNKEGGRESHYMEKFENELVEAGATVWSFNGGSYDTLSEILHDSPLSSCRAIIWAANVPNNLPKQRNVKELYPHTLFVATKRNNGEYSFQELVNRALGQKANLVVEFDSRELPYYARIFDPLGVVWQDYTHDIAKLARALVLRLTELGAFTRRQTLQADPEPLDVPSHPEFFQLVKEYADVFHSLLQPAPGVTRFLGNTSFRCGRGFPSLRGGTSEQIFVSRRNVDKRFIEPSAFVAVEARDGTVVYWGPNKPSVDTPIQVALYRELSAIRFMLHGHVYAENASYTKRPVPCGALEEIDKILALIPDRNTCFATVNLLGHGCLIMADSPEKFIGLPFIGRPMPEIITS
ncbi:MAG: hypothetical protein A3A28_05570 [Candidatus Sungbacteria bacterium RIFCSPLOWO2_01_FULL_47_32]|uniref:Class II aldolase/adducin N-terminal domain-containing protein n=1 Tax=Candidatus Sungbacteria bacterium RIFCSPHIGHO2_01_FULL_47_32 TaxID=1802264 RepID=A0A1G2K785_9BACT|nr:MAG: hypothetical protein UX72_C0001G0114 [Parcubacteria group bacterium GW2011_GWA2_47_10]OGZ94431.1 MAG: hypothetical protein A2633_04105 [Candidatus Sungbacteria bacterium RIFCSPHIGHO2_01_FULL_47_32]OGZ98023.1 MAG: hypothetical protein A3D57_02810 [Candidatus Sungbacteria bacterium RIFCSPHIGHO2_02_FULL_46_12]OHA05773.1 MAG: hypothetical protein A3A28_05570 [Candidatus Sungbacteria bacterium RIFCSPLOWO2_01_FULL_47_32]